MNGKKKKKTKISFTLNNANLMALKSHTRIVITRKQWNRRLNYNNTEVYLIVLQTK